MAKKIFTYKGFDEDTLKNMSIKEFAKIAPSRVRRSLTREMKEEHVKLLKKIREKGTEGGKPIRTHQRDFVIVPEMIGLSIMVYSGKEFVRVDIKAEMVGHYLGEFVLTRRHGGHGAPGVGATKSSMYVPLK